jgi:hypothetical protein
MAPRRYRNSFRQGLAMFASVFGRLTAIFKPAHQTFASQRICPFCSLITPRSGRFCLECGKSFGNA